MNANPSGGDTRRKPGFFQDVSLLGHALELALRFALSAGLSLSPCELFRERL
jgi:hypothetical protein